jgi:bifunctional DNase/RNase
MISFDNPLIKTMLKASGVTIDADETKQLATISKAGQVQAEITYNDFMRQIVEMFGGKIENVIILEKTAQTVLST